MTELLASATPVFLVDGEVQVQLARDLVRLEIEEGTEGLKRLSARFVSQSFDAATSDHGLLYLDGNLLDFGRALDVSIGRVREDRTVFRGFISALEASFHEATPAEVVVLAEDALMSLRMTRRSKTYREMTDAEIATAIADEHGLPPRVAAEGPRYDVVQQWNQSDLAFLRERARLIQAELWIQEGALHFQTRENRGGTSITLVRGNELLSVQLRADLAHQRTSVKVSGYDAQRRDRLEREAGADTIQAEISGGLTGPEVLERAFGERASFRVRDVPLVEGEADARARAEMLRRSRRFVTVQGVTSGTPDLAVGSRLSLDRVGRPFDGDGYYVTHVRHTYDQLYGHRTHFEAERPTLNEAP